MFKIRAKSDAPGIIEAAYVLCVAERNTPNQQRLRVVAYVPRDVDPNTALAIYAIQRLEGVTNVAFISCLNDIGDMSIYYDTYLPRRIMVDDVQYVLDTYLNMYRPALL